jgi:hypothetical protein
MDTVSQTRASFTCGRLSDSTKDTSHSPDKFVATLMRLAYTEQPLGRPKQTTSQHRAQYGSSSKNSASHQGPSAAKVLCVVHLGGRDSSPWSTQVRPHL